MVKIAMDAMSEMPRDTPTMRAGNGKGKIRLLTRQSLDGRTKARKQFDAIAEGIASDLGEKDLSTVQKHLIEAFAGCAIVLQSLNARILLGEQISISDQASAASTLVRIASRIGIDRAPRDISAGSFTPLRSRFAEDEVADDAAAVDVSEVMP